MTKVCTYIGIGLAYITLAFLPSVNLHAADDQFTISQYIDTTDLTPPTVPTGLTATPIASTQIDLSWNASTDNIAVGGYQVFRDNVQIATSTLTSYSDTGLTPSTTYGYRLVAFDTSFNYATSTATSTATTLASSTPTTTPEGGGGGGGSSLTERSTFSNVQVVSSLFDVTISWRTSLHTVSAIRWGETGSYELGSSVEEAYELLHERVITNLSPDTVYEFHIEAIDADERVTTYTGLFQTDALPDLTPPQNPSDVRAVRDEDDVVLAWTNPNDSDFSHVRILRNDLFYPTDPFDGFVVYEGALDSFSDQHIAAASHEDLYYTLFAFDEKGNYSSGAVVVVRIDKPSPDADDVSIVPSDAEKDPELEVTFSVLRFFQDNVSRPVINSRVRVDGSKKLVVSIGYDDVPEHLKTILVSFKDPENSDQQFSFLLRVNEDKTRYEATIAPFGRAAAFPVTFSVFDFKRQEIAYAHGTVLSEIRTTSTEDEDAPYLGGIMTIGQSFSVWLILFTLLLLAFGLISRTPSRHYVQTN